MRTANVITVFFCLAILGLSCDNTQPAQPVNNWTPNTRSMNVVQGSFENNGYYWEDQVVEGMTYRIYFRNYASSNTGYAIFVVNLTKDKLEVESLKRAKEKDR